MKFQGLLTLRREGLYCPGGKFFIDPWLPVEKAVITHTHSDHAAGGSANYLCSAQSKDLLKCRLGNGISLQTLNYGETEEINGVKLSLHPAGHILGSSQVRIEFRGEVWVVSGDYKLAEDSISGNFEIVKCNTFITESTFGLPIYRWDPPGMIFNEINNWWRKNKENEIPSIIFCYAMGKAQRILAGLDISIGPVLTHGSIETINNCYRESGVNLPQTMYIGNVDDKIIFNGAMILAPPSADTLSWKRKFGNAASAFASGWMQVRGTRRRRGVERGFPLSDHADWDGILKTVEGTGAETVWVTHGYSAVVAKWFRDKGLNSGILPARFRGEEIEGD